MRLFKILFAVSVAFMMAGCGLFQELDGSTDREIELFYGEKKDTTSQIERDILINTLMKEQEEQMKAEMEKKRLREEMLTRMPDQIAQISGSITVLKKEVHDLKQGAGVYAGPPMGATDVAAPAAGFGAAEEAPKTPVTVAELGVPPVLMEPLVQSPKTPNEISIKVLSGTGIMISAKRMSDKIKGMGYKVGRIDVAPYTFNQDTVFYNEGFRGEAEKLAARLGDKASVKPLTWKSIFQLIVVTGQ